MYLADLNITNNNNVSILILGNSLIHIYVLCMHKSQKPHARFQFENYNIYEINVLYVTYIYLNVTHKMYKIQFVLKESHLICG